MTVATRFILWNLLTRKLNFTHTSRVRDSLRTLQETSVPSDKDVISALEVLKLYGTYNFSVLGLIVCTEIAIYEHIDKFAAIFHRNVSQTFHSLLLHHTTHMCMVQKMGNKIHKN